MLDVVKSGTAITSWMGQVIEDTKKLLSTQCIWTTSFTYREVNVVAHALVKLAIKAEFEFVWIEEGPPPLVSKD